MAVRRRHCDHAAELEADDRWRRRLRGWWRCDAVKCHIARSHTICKGSGLAKTIPHGAIPAVTMRVTHGKGAWAPTETASEAGPKGAPPLIVLPSSHEYAQLISEGKEPHSLPRCCTPAEHGAVGERWRGWRRKRRG